MEVAWNGAGEYVGEGLNPRRRPKTLPKSRPHNCLLAHWLSSSPNYPHTIFQPCIPEHDYHGRHHHGCGVFICADCRVPTPWCMGAADEMPESCDQCWQAVAIDRGEAG